MQGFIEVDITTGDQVLPFIATGFWIGTGGDLAVEDEDGNAVIFRNIDAGTLLPVVAVKVLQVGTTATDVVALSVRGLID